jgi:hypothetical protein
LKPGCPIFYSRSHNSTNARQQQQIDALTAGLQKVSAAVELNKAAPTQVADTR